MEPQQQQQQQGNPPLQPPPPPPPPSQMNCHNPWGWDHPPPPPPPNPNFEWPGPGFSGEGFHNHHHHRHRDFRHNDDFHGGADHHHQFHNFNSTTPIDDSNSNFNHFPRKRKFDCNDGGNYAKLYVVGITRTVPEEEIRRLFEEYGNVVEVVLLNDKWTGEHHEYCFVKYSSTEEADRAILALNNQFTFPGAMAPIKVKYAVGEKGRLGLLQHDRTLSRSGMVQHDSTFSRPANIGPVQKVYVNFLNKEASEQEIMEIFSSYGVVADMYIMRDKSDNLKQSRGCGFVGFTHKYMAVAAINGLNGTYVMRGCDRPLVVRFADPKKPKNGDLRPVPNPLDMRGSNLPNISRPESTTFVKAPPVSDQLQCPASIEMQQPPSHQPFSPSKFSQMSLQQSQTLLVGCQSSRQMETQPQTPLHLNPTLNDSIEQQRDCQSRLRVQTNYSSEPSPCALSGSDLSEAPPDCDWSEHICPDGDKYYFNCVTCESKWEKPEEFVLYEQNLQSQQLQNRPSQESHPSLVSEAPTEEQCQIQAAERQRQSTDYEKAHLQMPCSVEHGHDQVQVETSPLGGPAFVK